jgi:hypothetical protein
LKFVEGEETGLERFEDILVQCIDDVKAGRASVEGCLERYPALRQQLEPLLRIALEVPGTPAVEPSPAFKIRARVWLMDRIHSTQAVTKRQLFRHKKQMNPAPLRRRFSMVGVILAILLTLSAAAGGTACASQDSLPGDTLYAVKLGTEQMRMMLPGNEIVKAELALSFAERRVGEMQALAENGRPHHLGMALEGYDSALNTTLTRVGRADTKGLAIGNITALAANATARHLSVLDSVYDMVPLEAKEAIAHARNVSETGYFHALAALAKNYTVKAAEINIAAMEARLNRIRARNGDVQAVETALEQFEAMADFGEEISEIAQQISLDATKVEGLMAEATSIHLEILAQAWERVPEQAQPAIEKATANMQMRHERRVQALEQKGVEPPASPNIPEHVQQRIRDRVQDMLGETEPFYSESPGGAPSWGQPETPWSR